MKRSRVEKKVDEKEAEEKKKIYNLYVDKRKEIMKNTSFNVEDVFGDFISKDSFSQEQRTELNNFFSENNVNRNRKINFNFLKPKKILIINRVLLAKIRNFSK